MRNIIKKIIREGVPHMHQPTGNSCGPTCLKMVHDFFVGDRFKIADICRACGTDWVVGTPPERMAKGLEYMGLEYVEHMGEDNPFQSLRDSIDKGHPCVIRTVTQGVPHWIIAVDYDGEDFKINDPWLGRIIYSEEQLDSIWHMRDYFYYEVISGDENVFPDYENEDTSYMSDEDYMSDETDNQVEISYFESEDEIVEALQVGLKVFKGQMPPKNLLEYLAKAGDWSISVKATYQGKIVGFYLLAEASMVDYLSFYMQRDYKCFSSDECNNKYPGAIRVDFNDFLDLEGVEGVALGVDNEYRGLGIGRKLIEHSQTLPYDYIWGQQYESLNNIGHWTKRREIAAYFPGLYITYEML